MFRTSIVHLQERSYAVCCNLVCLDTFCCYGGEGRIASSSSFTPITYRDIPNCTYSIRTPLKMDYWSPKHVELLNVTNKINHQIFCIYLDYRYFPKWYTVHTISNVINSFKTETDQLPDHCTVFKYRGLMIGFCHARVEIPTEKYACI